MKRRLRFVPALGAVLALLSTSGAYADHPDHPDHDPRRGGFPGHQHGGEEGHLPPVQRNVRLVGKAEVTNPTGAGIEDRIADVFAYGNHAYLAAADCDSGGVHVIDIHDLEDPVELTDAFIPTSEGSFVGEGIQVVRYRNRFFRGDLLIHQNESCFWPEPDPSRAGGVSLWDVTDPTNPEPVTLHTGDFTNPEGGLDPGPNRSHSMRHWYDAGDRKHYVALVDNEEATNVDILDITDPYHPVLVNDTLDLVELFGVDQPEPPSLTEVLSHDMMIERVGHRYVMNVNYWDGGFVVLDVTDPTPGKVELVAETDYALLDEEALARGRELPPGGNAHQSELSPGNRYLIGTDELLIPYRVTGTIESGPHTGTEYEAWEGVATPPITEETVISGPTTFVGDACSPVAPGTGTALVEESTCDHQVVVDNVTAAGYSAGVMFGGLHPDCQYLWQVTAEGTIPFAFVVRAVGLQLLGQEVRDAPCTQPAPAVGSPSAETTIRGAFEGWGYVRLFRTRIPGKPGRPGSIEQVDTYAIPESQDPAYAYGHGLLSVHEVAVDPERPLAYFSYYAGGFRVAEYGRHGLREVGAFVDQGGNDFWGVEVHERRHRTYVLASDRDYGLYVFRYTPPRRPGDRDR